MSKVEFARDKLRTKFLKLMDEYEAMIVFLARMDQALQEKLAAQRNEAVSANKRQLQLGTEKLSQDIHSLRRKTGATQHIGYYTSLLRKNPRDDDRIRSMPIYMSVALFNKYPRVADALEKHELPPHATIELDYVGLRQRPPQFEFRMPEAMLFEDMCFFWNESCALTEITNQVDSEKIELKRLIAFHRATVSSAFYMVEAFCNGLALEVWLSRRDDLSERELQMITEWDTKHSRPRYQSIREKLLHYPRLLVAAGAPLIQENNSPELDYFLTSAKDLRDAIVHANPAPNFTTLEPPLKSQALESLGHEQCGRVVDSSIAVIDQILSATERRKSAFWLQRRQENGLFDKSVFD